MEISRKLVLVTVAALLTGASGAVGAFALPGAGLSPSLTVPACAQASNQDECVRLSQDVTLPDMPAFPGQYKFSSGLMFPNIPGGPAYHLRYSTPSDGTQIIEWYKNSLPSYGWKINSSGAGVVRATKDRNHCTISLRSPLADEKNCIEIHFRMAKK